MLYIIKRNFVHIATSLRLCWLWDYHSCRSEATVR